MSRRQHEQISGADSTSLQTPGITKPLNLDGPVVWLENRYFLFPEDEDAQTFIVVTLPAFTAETNPVRVQLPSRMVSMQGNVKDNNVLPCPGAPPITTNRIDATRYFGWHYKRLEPFGPSSNIVVQSWSTTNRIVKVTVAIRESVEDAKKEIRSFLQFRREPQELTGFGDEAFAPERDGSDIVLRRGRYVIYVSTVADIDSEADVRNLSKAELDARRKSEVQRIGKEFAKQLSSIELP